MATIERRESASGRVRWTVRVFIGRDPGTGKRRFVTRTFGRKRDATAEANRLERMKDRGALTTPSRVPLRDYLGQWLVSKAGRVGARTIHDYQGILTRYVIAPPDGFPPIGAIPLNQLTPEAIETLYGHMWQDVGLAPRTIQYLHATIRQALGDAVRTGALHRNPTDYAQRPTRARSMPDASRSTQRPAKVMRAMSQEEAGRFLEASTADRYAALWAVLLLGGLRPAEALGLRWDDVDLAEGRVHVQRALTRRGVTRWQLLEPKTDRARRVVPLPKRAIDALRTWRKVTAQERLQLGGEYEDNGLVFVSPFGRALDQGNLRARNFNRICAAAELGEWRMRRGAEWVPWDGQSKRRRFRPTFRMYDLRHTCATLLLRSGVAAKIVSERLGHASITLTLDTYSHVLPDMQQSAVAALDAAFGANARA